MTVMRGGQVVVADRFYPSSKTCSACGHRLEALPLVVREWTCPACGVVHENTFADMGRAADALTDAGFEVYGHVMRGTGHGIAPDGLSVALSFLHDKLPR